MLDGYLNAFAYAGSVKGETAIQACECYTQENGPFAHFGYRLRESLESVDQLTENRLCFPMIIYDSFAEWSDYSSWSRYLSRNILTFFQTGECPYPVERTLLTTCMIDAAMESR